MHASIAHCHQDTSSSSMWQVILVYEWRRTCTSPINGAYVSAHFFALHLLPLFLLLHAQDNSSFANTQSKPVIGHTLVKGLLGLCCLLISLILCDQVSLSPCINQLMERCCALTVRLPVIHTKYVIIYILFETCTVICKHSGNFTF